MLVLLQTVLTFVGTVMMMYASNWCTGETNCAGGKVWYLLSYDISLFALGGKTEIINTFDILNI